MRRIALLALLGVLAAGCGVGDGQARADAIARGARSLAAAGMVAGALTVELELDEASLAELEGGQRDAFAALVGGDDAGPSANRLELDVTADLARGAARLSAGDEPLAIFDGAEIYVRRQNARTTERRVWATLDLHDLTNDERPLLTRDLAPGDLLTAVALSINPTFLVELGEGALAGSTKPVGTEEIAGVATRRFRTNVAPEQALDNADLDDDDTDARRRLHHLLRTWRDVMPAEFWLDEEGRVRQLRVELTQRVTRRRSNTLFVTLQMTDLAVANTTVEPPPADTTVTYEAFGRLVASGFRGEG